MEQDKKDVIAQAQEKVTFGVAEVREMFREFEKHVFEHELISRVVTLLIASLGLITALAWDSVASELILVLFPYSAPVAQKLFYALGITLVTAVISVLVARRIRKGREVKARQKKTSQKNH
jgi:hypothetical protein